MYERQKAYRKRRAEREARMEQTLRDIRHMLRESDKETAVKIRGMVTLALDDEEGLAG